MNQTKELIIRVTNMCKLLKKLFIKPKKRSKRMPCGGRKKRK